MTEHLKIVEVDPNENLHRATHVMMHSSGLYVAYGDKASLDVLLAELAAIKGVDWSDVEAIKADGRPKDSVHNHHQRINMARDAAIKAATGKVKVATGKVKVDFDEDSCSWTCPKCGTEHDERVSPSDEYCGAAYDDVDAKCECGWKARIALSFHVTYDADSYEVEEL